MEYLICNISGGLGKNVCASVAVRCLKKQYPDKKIVVISGWPEVFNNNPNVHATFRPNEEKYAYSNYVVKGSIINGEPYQLDNYRFNDMHLTEAYCEAWGVEFDGNYKPDIYLDEEARVVGAKVVSTLKNQMNAKKLIVVQPRGAQQIEQQSQALLPTGRENPELFQMALQSLSQKYKDVMFMLMKTSQQPVLDSPNVAYINNDYHYRVWMSIIAHSDGVLGIDSCAHHIGAAFDKPAVVVWGRTSHKNLGYKGQMNVVGNCEEGPCNGFLQMPVSGWICNHSYKCIKNIKVETLTKATVETLIKEKDQNKNK